MKRIGLCTENRLTNAPRCPSQSSSRKTLREKTKTSRTLEQKTEMVGGFIQTQLQEKTDSMSPCGRRNPRNGGGWGRSIGVFRFTQTIPLRVKITGEDFPNKSWKKHTAFPPCSRYASRIVCSQRRAIASGTPSRAPKGAEISGQKQRERERDLGKTKHACESLGATQRVPLQTKRLLGPCDPKQTLEQNKKPNRRGS